MSRIPMVAIVAVLLAGFASLAIAAQDKYSLKLGKLSFGDFRGYETGEIRGQPDRKTDESDPGE